ncbi:hypothetical protein [Pseudactinotalea sp.]|uniref:hypothetical protein n=1 Tax=Pseudactinotalea sp. TaxID=1926260 RepID=UPI003B3B138D
MSARSARVAALVAVLLVGTTLPAAADSDDEDVFAEALDGGFGVARTSHLSNRIDDTATTTSEATLQDTRDAYEAARVVCFLRQGADEDGELLNEETELCESDDEDGLTTAEVVALVSQEFQTLSLAAPVISVQPEGDWALVNMDYIVFTEPGQQVLDTTILGVPVTIRATPVHYSWDFGDGSAPLATTDPGQPYPNQTVSHVYSSAVDAVSVTLTTSWQGELQIGGSGTWLPIAGMATTTSSTAPVEIVAMDVHLVPND